MTARSVESIRADFPALERTENGHPVAYFDGPGGTQVPRSVADAMVDYLFHHNANTHWAYPTSAETDALLERSREVYAAFFNASPLDVSFGNNMTTIAFHLARGIARRMRAGDEIVVTQLDHHGNLAPWKAIAKEHGFVLRTVRLDPKTFRHHADDLANAITKKTKLVAVGAASNALGTITDVAALCAQAREAGAMTFVDAVHYAPHTLLDVEKIGCDFLGCSAYKFYGPHVGVLYGRRALVDELEIPKLDPAPELAPERVETGTQNHEGIVGAAAAVEYIASIADGMPDPVIPSEARSAESRNLHLRLRTQLKDAFTALHERGDALLEHMWSGLSAIDGVTMYGPQPGTPRTPTVAFTVRGYSTEDVARALVNDGVYASNGDFYAATVAEVLQRGEDGFVRAGCACYTTEEEIDRLVTAVGRLAKA
jgi:cysteine desulfurase family protein (TIGR01976 family)